MSLPQRQSRLRLAHVAEPASVSVVVDRDNGEASSDALVLLRPGVVPAAMSSPGRRRITVQLSTHGLAVRYLHRLVAQAAGAGWDVDCAAAFATELERRYSYLIVAGGRLPGRPPVGRVGLRRADARLWRAGTWVSGGAEDLAAQLVIEARTRDDVMVAVSSEQPVARAARGMTSLLLREGLAMREAGRGTCVELGCRWAVEVLAVPRLTAEHLGGLGERFAAAPRCEWCALPVIGTRCRRCSAGGRL